MRVTYTITGGPHWHGITSSEVDLRWMTTPSRRSSGRNSKGSEKPRSFRFAQSLITSKFYCKLITSNFYRKSLTSNFYLPLICVFKAASEREKANATKNQYPHRLGSGGYKTAKAKWSTDKTPLPSSSDSSGLSQDEIDRAYWWYLARTSVHPETGENIGWKGGCRQNSAVF